MLNYQDYVNDLSQMLKTPRWKDLSLDLMLSWKILAFILDAALKIYY